MGKKIYFLLIMIIFLFPSAAAYADTPLEVEIFHINKGKVVAKKAMTPKIHKETEAILQGITDLYRQFDPFPDQGYMVRIPLDPAIPIKNEWAEELVSEVILIFPEYENPHLMIFNDENMPLFFHFQASVDGIIKELNLKLKGMK